MGAVTSLGGIEEIMDDDDDVIGVNESSDIRQQNDTAPPPPLDDPQEESWSCVRCTLLNHPALNVCECCMLERYSASTEGEFLTLYSASLHQSRMYCSALRKWTAADNHLV